MQSLLPLAEKIAARLIARKETIAVAESSTGGLIAAALLSVPGASAYFLGGAVVYTQASRAALLGISDAEMEGLAAVDRSLCVIDRAARARAARRDLGSWRNRRDGADRQPLRRCGGSQLHGDFWPGRARDHVGDGQCRPAGEHGCFRQARAGTCFAGNDIGREIERTTPPLPPSPSAPRRGIRRSA